jgi:hypothetical protein
VSHYTAGEVQIKDAECLALALQELGFKPEVHVKPVHLYGYHGDVRPEVAHVVIPRKQIGGASNDVGFFFDAAGRCQAIISEYDSRRFSDAWVKKMTALAGVHYVLRQAQRKGQKATRTVDQRGNIQVRVLVGR